MGLPSEILVYQVNVNIQKQPCSIRGSDKNHLEECQSGPQTNSITWEIWGNANIWTLSQPIESESLGVGLGVSGSYAFYWLGSTEFNWAWIGHGGHQPRWWQRGLLLDCTGACGKEPA